MNLSSINATAIVQTEFAGMTLEGIFLRLRELVLAPYYHREMIWIVFPLFVSLFLMQLYFGRYRDEELGWNTAIGNSLALVFVSVDLIRHIYFEYLGTPFLELFFTHFFQVSAVFFIGFASFWLLFGEFFHIVPKKFAFLVSSSLPTFLTAYVAISIVYTGIPVEAVTFVAGIFFLVILSVFFWLVRHIEPAAKA